MRDWNLTQSQKPSRLMREELWRWQRQEGYRMTSTVYYGNPNLRNFHLNGEINRTGLLNHSVYEQPCVLFIPWSQYRKPELTMQRSRIGWRQPWFTLVKGSPDFVIISIFTIPYFPEITIFGLVYGGSDSPCYIPNFIFPTYYILLQMFQQMLHNLNDAL